MRKSVEALRAERDKLMKRAEELATLARTDGQLADDDADEFDGLAERLEVLKTDIETGEASIARVRALIGSGHYAVEHGSPRTGTAAPTSERDRAMRTLERATKAGRLHERGAELVESLLTGSSWAQRWAVAAGDPSYERAFAKLAYDPQRGHLTWSADEAAAFRAVETLQQEQRALGIGGSGSGGSYLVPLTLDPSVLLSNAGSINPLREVSRVIPITSDSWHGVSSAGVTAEWLGEGSEAADGTPTLTAPVVPTFKGSAFVPFSVELEGDGQNLIQELRMLLSDAAIQLANTAYTTGNGTTAPKGIVTALVAASTPIVTGDGSEVLAASDFYKIQNALAPRFQAGARFVANLATINTARQFETTSGALKFPSLQETPPSLLGRPIHENSGLDGVINAAATEANYLAIYGDFSQFAIVERVGATMELIPHLVGSNRRPVGQRGAWLWWRTGSDVLVPNAFKILNVATTA